MNGETSAFTASEMLPRLAAPKLPAIIDEPEYSVDRLAAMNLVEYELHRKRAAEALGLEVGILDKLVKAAQLVGQEEAGEADHIPSAPWYPMGCREMRGAPIDSVSSSSPPSDAPSVSTTPTGVPASAVAGATVPSDLPSDNVGIATESSPPVAWAPVRSVQVDCTNIQDRVFDTPEEAGQARAAWGLQPRAVIPFAPSKDPLYRAQAPAPIPQTHHGRN